VNQRILHNPSFRNSKKEKDLDEEKDKEGTGFQNSLLRLNS
jgi:hypothetical protein